MRTYGQSCVLIWLVSLGGGLVEGVVGLQVPVDSLGLCPPVPPRAQLPTNASNVRPDDIKVVMALGDSITAGFLARSGDSPQLTSPDQIPLGIKSVPPYDEWRGLAYPIGGDPGAITLPNILAHWSDGLEGMSRGHHPAQAFLIPGIEGEGNAEGNGNWRGNDDGLNGAVSGSHSESLVGQVVGRILPKLKKMKVDKESWKFVNVAIGANDVCALCLAPNSTVPVLGSPIEFARGVRDAVELLRKNVPNLIVNIVGLLHVSAVYRLVVQHPYCRGALPPPTPHLPWQCSCAFLPGPLGDYTRSKMDELSDEYDAALIDIIEAWNAEDDPGFGVAWQPGSMIDFSTLPITAISPVDCFHPSEATHQRVAAALWDRLTLSREEKAVPLRWEEDIKVRCMDEGDRITIGV